MIEAKRLLVDTNVWLDYYLQEGAFDEAKHLVELAEAEKIDLLYAPTTAKDVFYILPRRLARRNANGVNVSFAPASWACIEHMMQVATASPLSLAECEMARMLGKRMPDLEDNLIIASGETLVQCLRYVTDYYRKQGAKLRNILLFTIGGTQGIEILEKLTKEIRTYWPDFEGFITVYYEGVFSCYEEGDKGVSGINRALIDFYWKGGIVAPEFRRQTLSMQNPLFEKCTIYDGGARRYEIHEHIEEVLEFWEGIRERADQINFPKLLEEKLGYELPIDYEDWIAANHYGLIRPEDARWLYRQEQGYVESMKNVTVKELAEQRIAEFTGALRKYIL
mgnify:CR=1 FL=1